MGKQKGKLKQQIRKLLQADKCYLTEKLKNKTLIQDKYSDEIEALNNIFKENGCSYYIDPDNWYLKQDENSKNNLIADFFVIIKAIITVDYYFKKDRYLFCEVVALNNKTYTSILLREEEIENKEWIKKYLKPKNYNLIDDYKKLLKTINISKKNKLIETIKIRQYSGWAQKNSTWNYEFKNTCFSCLNFIYYKMLDERGGCASIEKECYLESLKLLDIAPQRITMPLLAYCILGVLNEIFKKIHLEPNFILFMNGTKETFVTQLVELFSKSLNPSKKPEQYCTSLINHNCQSEVPPICYTSEPVDHLKNVLSQYKDTTVIIDGIMTSKNNHLINLTKKLLINYLNKDRDTKANKQVDLCFNILPILISNDSIDHDLYYTIRVDKDEVNSNDLLDFRSRTHWLTKSMQAFLEYIEDSINESNSTNSTGSLFEDIQEIYFDIKRTLFYSNLHYNERDAAISAWMLCAFKLYLKYGDHYKYISNEEYNRYYNGAFKLFCETPHRQETLDDYLYITQRKIDINRAILEFLETVSLIYNQNKRSLPDFKDDPQSEISIYTNSNDNEELLVFFNCKALINNIKKHTESEILMNVLTNEYYDHHIKKLLKLEQILKTDKDKNRYTYSLRSSGRKVSRITISVNNIERYLKNCENAENNENFS